LTGVYIFVIGNDKIIPKYPAKLRSSGEILGLIIAMNQAKADRDPPSEDKE
jgi:hypothetical protein